MSAGAGLMRAHSLPHGELSGWATGSLLARWTRLFLGLWVFAVGIALMVRADLGVSSWDVLHDALRLHTALSFGGAVIIVSVAVVIASFFLGVKPGAGTIANVLFVGAFTDAILVTGVLDGLPSDGLVIRIAALVAGVLAIALGTALYIGASLGAGPRDSLMLASATRFRVTAGTARAFLEGSVLLLGALLGGAVGIGTAVFVVAIGPAINLSFRAFGMETKPRPISARPDRLPRIEK